MTITCKETTYGKVTVKLNRGAYHVLIGVGNGEAMERIVYRKDEAYSDARWLRGCFKLGKHPRAIVCQHGYRLIGMEDNA